MLDEILIFGNSNMKHQINEIVEASYKGMKCSVKIVRVASKEEYLDYLRRMNFQAEPCHGPYYYAALAD